MPSGLKGALLGFGNPLLDISAGASLCPCCVKTQLLAGARRVARAVPV